MGTFDLIANIFCVTVLPLLILVNFRDRHAPKAKMSAYLWANHPNLAWLGLAFLSLIAVMCAIDLAGHFGYLSAEVVKSAQLFAGIPMLIMSFAIIGLGLRALYLARSKP